MLSTIVRMTMPSQAVHVAASDFFAPSSPSLSASDGLAAAHLASEPEPAQAVPSHPLLRGLNDEQLRAVTLPARAHALVLAGAGSGKTRVLTTRIAWLLHRGEASPSSVLAVTFTNKAAREMSTRLSAMLPVDVRSMWLGTFHGLCHRLLRRHHQAAGLPAAFQVLDTQDQLSAIKRLCKAFAVDEDRYPPRDIQRFISACKEAGQRVGDVTATDSDTQRRLELYHLYEQQCQREGVVDFGELMLRSFELLRDNPALREHYQRRFTHILVDEFQDTNRLQYDWLRQLAGTMQATPAGPLLHTHACVLAVGDDDQSIYAFRGARVANMKDFLRDFQITQPIRLEKNYRSAGHILDCANMLISHNGDRLGKDLHPTHGAGEKVRLRKMPSDMDEARFVVEEIQAILQQGDFARREIAILYRNNAQSRSLENQLFSAGIAYRVYGGLRFFERLEIKQALAYLRLLENPHDDTSFVRVVNFPPRGIGSRTLETLQEAARAQSCSLMQAAAQATTGRSATSLQGFVALLDVMRERVAGATLRETIEAVLELSGLLAHYRDPKEKDGPDRLENLLELLNAAESFTMTYGLDSRSSALHENAQSRADRHALDMLRLPAQMLAQTGGLSAEKQGPAPATVVSGLDEETGEILSPLAAFLTHAALEAGDNQAQDGQDAVQLMTVHAAKGLEFDAVFITGLEDGLFPHFNATSDPSALEEERRLMYVAITRARQRLYLCLAERRMVNGRFADNPPSRFLRELPEAALHLLAPMHPARATMGTGSTGGGWPSGTSRAVVARPAWGHSALGTTDTPGFTTSTPASAGSSQPPHTTASATQPGGTNAIRSGSQVFHAKFGEGRVLAVEGSGAEQRAQVDFPRHGVKWLALSVAKLTVI